MVTEIEQPCERGGDVLELADETVKLLCQKEPGKAFDFGVAVLTRGADMMASIVEETRIDLIEVEMRRKQIDRVQARV